MLEILERLTAAPRLPCRPADLIMRDWRLTVKSDGCDKGVGACLLLVRPHDDGEVTAELMLDPDRVRLIATDSKVLSESQQRWLTFEVEMYGMYRALRKWAGMLMQVAQLGNVTWPPLLWMDSTTAVAKWVGVSVPAVIDHACAKEKRFLGWSEKVSYVRWMKFEMKWIPGSANDFADLLSRMADRLHQCIEERGASLQMYHMHVAVVHHVSGYEAYDLGLDSDQRAEVKRAYLMDDGTVQSVKLSDVYRCVCMHGEGVSSEVKMKVAPWVDRRFFSVEPPGSGGVRVVYTPRAQLREQWEQRDQSRVLVLMVPAGAMVRITTGKPVTGIVAEVPEY